MRAVFALAFLALAAAGVPDAAGAATAAARPRIAALQVQVWPEFDRPGTALVILSGDLDAGASLPATVSLRVPSSSEPAAVAFATAPDSDLFNLAHERIAAGDFTTLRFTTSHRRFHVEFYDRLPTDKPERQFTYVWPGDMAVEDLVVRLQEPAGATAVVTKPVLGTAEKGQDGLTYRKASLGRFDADTWVPIEVRYTKPDSRTSSEILGLKPAGATAVPASASPASAPPASTPPTLPLRWLLVAVLAAVGIGAAGIVLAWPRLRRTTPGARGRAAGFCPKCGKPLAVDDRYCSGCGKAVSAR